MTNREFELLIDRIDGVKTELKEDIQEIKDQNADIIESMITEKHCGEIRGNCTKKEELNINKLKAVNAIISTISSMEPIFILNLFSK